jgi:hypothetical protein
MTIDWTFPRRIAMVTAVAILILAYPLSRIGSAEVNVAVIAGGVLSTVNVLAGFLMIELTFEKSYSTFLKAVLGGMGIIMVALLGLMALGIAVLHLHTLAFATSLLGFYLVYLVLEILYLQKKVDGKSRG